MKRIGILGGTFNPVHFAHLFMALTAYESAGLDKVVFMPSKNQNYKSTNELASNEDRLKMLKLAVREFPFFEVSDFEMMLEGEYSFTYMTLDAYKKQYPDCELYFIIGADSLMKFDTWRHPELIIKECRLLAFYRSGISEEEADSKLKELEKKYSISISLIEMPYIGITSTMIRQRAFEGKELGLYLPSDEAEYIREKGLYRRKNGT